MSAPRKNRPRRRSADKRAILQDHYLFRKLTPQHIDRLSTPLAAIGELGGHGA
jgi:hypothetical protein